MVATDIVLESDVPGKIFECNLRNVHPKDSCQLQVILFFLLEQVGLLLQLKFVVKQFHAFLLYFSFTQWMFGLLCFL